MDGLTKLKTLNQTVVITGATSFIGMHLCNMFAKNNWRVIAAHSEQTSAHRTPQLERISQLTGTVEFEKFDVSDKKKIRNIVNKYAPDVWIQHAGYTCNYGSPNFDFNKGIAVNAGAIPILFDVLKNKSCGIIITGSEAEYGHSRIPHKENDIPQPDSLYGITKLAQTITAHQQSDFYSVPTRVARLFLPFGTFDHPKKVIPLVTEALKNNFSIDLSPCSQTRDFTGVRDICEAYLKLAQDLTRGGFDVFNICSGFAVELNTVLKLIAKALGANQSNLKFGTISMREGEPQRIIGNNDKARTLLSWCPRSLDVALIEDLNLSG